MPGPTGARLYTGCRRDNGAAANKEAALDDADDHRDVLLESPRIADRAEPAIKDEIAAIGTKRLLADAVPDTRSISARPAILRARAQCRALRPCFLR